MIKKAFVFDFDDTLAFTDCMVVVRLENGEILRRLTPSEYNQYELPEGCKFDYSEFESLINPRANFMMALAKEVYNEQHSIYILTARGSAAADGIHQFLTEHNIDAKEIICVGDSAKDIAKEKRTVLMTIMENFDKVYFYDDDEKNVAEARSIGIKANLV